MKLARIAAILILATSFNAVVAEEENQNIKNLKSSDDGVVVQALKNLAEEKNEESTTEIALLLTMEKSYAVKSNAIMTLGKIRKKGEPVNKLKQFLQVTEDRNLAYLAIAALINIKDIDNPSSEQALNIAEKRFKGDIYIADACKKIRQMMASAP